MPARHRLGFTLLAGLWVIVGCGDDGPTEVEGLPSIEGAPEVVVIATDFQFEPSVIEIQAGEPVNIVLEVTDGGHNLGIAQTEFVLPIVDEGERTSGGLVIDEPGTYQLVCTVPGHLSEGMVGSVEVRA
jgi:plastocyanin